MKIHILTYTKRGIEAGSQWTQLEMLRESAESLGHEIELVHASECQLRFFKKPEILVNNEKPNIDMLLVKAGFLGGGSGAHVSLIKQFELSGTPVVNKHYAVRSSKDKVKNIQVLQKNDIPTPRTIVVRSSKMLEDVVKTLGKYPLILKTSSGSLGVGVMIVESKRAMQSLVEMLHGQRHVSVVIQEYVKESSGKDIRVFVVGDKVVAAMERIARKRGEFRSNYSLGGKVRALTLTKEEEKLAIRAAKACELEMAGVDLIRTKTGPKILEVNSNPGIEGITEATGVDIAGKIIKYCVKKHRRNIREQKKVDKIKLEKKEARKKVKQEKLDKKNNA
jgi:ribosomal protein S6--L-glutamate ligase